MSQGVKKACYIIGFMLLGYVLSHYGFCWSFYGMGHTSHACNVVGNGIILLSPVFALIAFALIASRKLKVADGWKGAILVGLLVFLMGPVLYFLVGNALYRLGLYELCGFPPPLGWG